MGFIKNILIVSGLAVALLFCFGLNSDSVQADAIKKERKHGGPPPWAPAHGYRAKFRYYPKQKVYYYPERKQYFWVDSGIVKVGLKLPDWIKISGSGVDKELDTDKPKIAYFK